MVSVGSNIEHTCRVIGAFSIPSGHAESVPCPAELQGFV